MEVNQISTSASEACIFYQNLYFWTSTPPLDSSLPSRQWLWTWVQHSSSRHLSMSPRPYPSRLSSTTNDIFRCMQNIWCSVVVKVQNSGVRGLGFVPILGCNFYIHKFNIIQVQIYIYIYLLHQKFYIR